MTLDYDKIMNFKTEQYTDEFCLGVAAKRFPQVEDMTEEEKLEVIKLVRIEIYDAYQHDYLFRTYQVQIQPVDDTKKLLTIMLDELAPIGDPRRMRIEIAFKESLLVGTLDARKKVEKTHARHPQGLALPKRGLIVPGSNHGSQN